MEFVYKSPVLTCLNGECQAVWNIWEKVRQSKVQCMRVNRALNFGPDLGFSFSAIEFFGHFDDWDLV